MDDLDKKVSEKCTSLNQIPLDYPVWYHPEAILGSAVRHVASLSSKFNWVGIYVLRGQFLELGPYLGAETVHTQIPVGQGICGIAVSENRNQNIPDVQSHPHYLACSLETKSELVVLIRNQKGTILGQIDIDSHFQNSFGTLEVQAVEEVAHQLGIFWPLTTE